ncbi:MAG: tetratricopeptide repeat protein [Candidatus Marinimicrobia bacterium]|nr:tetratricopeptide repeat protein [Candidatus Neomarinimicrobiota bacterium]
MLQPKKKITKKELKHDPLLDTLEKGKEFYEENAKQILSTIAAVLVLFLLVWGWVNSRQSSKNAAMLANTKTILAVTQGLNDNVISELELVVEEYGNRDEIALSALQLGVAKMDAGDNEGARKLFTQLAKSSDKQVKIAGKLKLAYLDEKEANYTSAAGLYSQVATLDEGMTAKYAKLQAGYAFLNAGNVEKARNIVTDLLLDDPTGKFGDQVKYLEGKVLEK